MKKYCKFLLIFILPLLLLTSCNSKSSISNFENDFYNMSTSSAISFQIDNSGSYSKNDVKIITFNFSQKLNEAINSNSKYSYINNFYIPLLDNSLSCIYSYSTILQNTSITKEENSNICNVLREFQDKVKIIDENIANLENSLNISNDLNNLSNTENLKNVYTSFESVIDPANNLSSLFSHLYYKYYLSSSSINYNEYSENKQAPKVVIQDICINTLSKYSYYKSLYSNIYYKMYVKNKNIPQRIINGESINISFRPYKNICSSTVNYKSTLQQSLIEANSSLILENGIVLYNMEKELDYQYSLFNTALANLNSKDTSVSSSAELFINNFINNLVILNSNSVYLILKNAYN